MPKPYLLSFVLAAFAPHFPAQMGVPAPESPYRFPLSADNSVVYKSLNATVKDYKVPEWQEVEKSIKFNNKEVEQQIAELNAKFQAKYAQLEQLSSASNLLQLKAEWENLQKEKDDYGKVAEYQFKPINYQGLYLAICTGVSSRIPLADLQRAALDNIKPNAIRTLNNAFVQNLTEGGTVKPEFEGIRKKVLGNMEVVNMEYQDRDYSSGDFVQIWKVRVSPMLAPSKSEEPNFDAGNFPHIMILDLQNTANVLSQLKNYLRNEGFRSRLDQQLGEMLSEYQKQVNAYNANMKNNQTATMNDVKNMTREHMLKTGKAENEFNQKKSAIGKIFNEAGVPFDINRLSEGVAKTQAVLVEQMKDINRQKLAKKAEEMASELFTGIEISVNPNRELADFTVEKVATLNKDKSKLSGFLQSFTQTGRSTQLNTSPTIQDVYREIETYWLYPIPSGSKFDLGIVAKFRVKQGSSCNDQDGDGICDQDDRCPDQKGPAASFGCPSSDNADIPMPEMVYVEGGTFQMGGSESEAAADEKPVHQVTVNSFYIGRYEITKAQFAVFVAETGYLTQDDKDGKGWVYDGSNWIEMNGMTWRENSAGTGPQPDDQPVMRVSWEDAVAYCDWLSRKTGMAFWLPSEAEWEFAARGGNEGGRFKYAGSNEPGSVGWHIGNSGAASHECGVMNANELGIYDMSGNVWEWCSDWYAADYYGKSPSQNPLGPQKGTDKVVRGGSWGNPAEYARCANRDRRYPTSSYRAMGFRVMRVP